MHADDSARNWLEQHSTSTPRVIADDVHRCYAGGKICQVTVRDLSSRDETDRFEAGTLSDGTTFLIDKREYHGDPNNRRVSWRSFV